jgi:hypothetical protein
MATLETHKRLKSLQVLVFQGGLASRNFEIPLSWFARLGWIFGGSILVAALSTGTALLVWRTSHESQPERLKELELQIQTLETQLAERPQSLPSPVAPAASLQAEPVPAPTVTVTVTAPAETSLAQFNPFAQKATPSDSAPIVGFTAFPPSVTGVIPWVARPSVPIEMTPPQLQWQGKKLKLKFDIRYVGPEGKSQQGRIIVAARGPETLIVYPTGALRPTGSGSLFDPEQGEYFSVARFRETRVELPSVDSPLRTLEIFLIGQDSIDQQNKILIHETLNVPPLGGNSRAAADPENP